MEEKIQKFYLNSADIPRLFERIAQKRDNRKIQAESIYYKPRTNCEVIYDRED